MQWLDNVKAVLTNPNGFYSQMPASGGYGEPVKFAVPNFAIYGILSGIVTMLGIGVTGPSPLGTGPMAIVSSLVASVIGGVIFLFILAAFFHIGLKIVGGKGAYEATFRVMSYATSTSLLIWIPYIGVLFGLYNLYLNVVGMSTVHQIGKGRALIGIILPLIVLAVLFALFLVAFLGSLVALLGLPFLAATA